MMAETTPDPMPATSAQATTHGRSHTTKRTTSPHQKTPSLGRESPRGATRALPGWAIDLITDGVAPRELWKCGNQAVFGALVSTAMSAQHRHWSIMEWEALILDRKRKLVSQLRRSSGAPDTPARIRQVLLDAWDRAWANRTNDPAWDADALAREIAERFERAMATVIDQSNALSDSDRIALRYAAQEMVSRGITRVALPWREVMKATELPERTTKNALKRLHALGALHLAQPGAPGGPRSKRRLANIYEVAPNKSRETRPVGQPAAKVGPPPATLNGTPLGAAPSGAVSASIAPSVPASTAEAPGLRITRQPDGRIVLESTAANESALIALLTTLVSSVTESLPAA